MLDRSSYLVRSPLSGVTVVRFAGERPLMRAVPDRHGTTLQLAGHSHWTSGRSEWSSAPGSVAVKVPAEVTIERAREGELDCQVVLFDPALVDEARAALARPILAPRTHAVDLRDPRSQPLMALHRALLDESAPPALDELLCDALHAVVDLAADPGQRPSVSAAVVRARALLDERVTETVTLEELAAHARVDKFRLCRAFREEIGLPPHAYVTHRRVALAQSLLSRGLSQAEVAVRVGFYDQSLLHRHFKRIVGLTPGAYVRSHFARV